MKLGVVRRIVKEDLAKAGEQIPKWVDALLGPLNEFIEKVGLALQNRLTFSDNFLCKVIALDLTSDVEQEINPATDFSANARVYGVLIVSSDNKAIAHHRWAQKTNGNIGVTVTFVSASSATCTLILLLR